MDETNFNVRKDVNAGTDTKQTCKSCFVIMPFAKTTEKHTAGYWKQLFDEFIKPTVENLGYSCERSVPMSTNIVEDILAKLVDSDLVLAVLTDHRHNVLWELGVRHAFHHGTIMLVEDFADIPSNVKAYGGVRYNGNMVERDAFEGDLEKFIDNIKKMNKTDSPVGDFFDKRPVKPARVAVDAQDSPLAFQKALSCATQTLLVVGQNLFSLTRGTPAQCKMDTFRTLREKSMNIQLLLCDLEPKCISKATEEFTHNGFVTDLNHSVNEFTQWQKQADAELAAGELKGKLEIRLSTHIGNLSLTFVDPDLPTGMLEVTPVVYASDSLVRARFILTKREHRALFQSYWGAYRNLFDDTRSRSIRDIHTEPK